MKMKTNQFIGVWTAGVMALSSEVREAIERAFTEALKNNPDDWFYKVSVDGKGFFIAENGEFGYTAMLPDEY